MGTCATSSPDNQAWHNYYTDYKYQALKGFSSSDFLKCLYMIIGSLCYCWIALGTLEQIYYGRQDCRTFYSEH